MSVVRSLIPFLALLGACYSPTYPEGLRCPQGRCPGSQVCVSGTCYQGNVELPDAAPELDADLTPRLTVMLVGDGVGRVTSSGAAIDCGTSCTVSYTAPTQLTLRAVTQNGDDSYFRDWSGDCQGGYHECVINVDGPRTVVAHFSKQSWNLVFVSSQPRSGRSGGVAGYDAFCNTLATNEGINNLAGTGFVSWLSVTGNTAPASRSVTDQISELLTNNVIWNPIALTETGAPSPVAATEVMTGTRADGSVGDNCSDFSTTADTSDPVTAGRATAGPGTWTEMTGPRMCGTASPIYCFGRLHTQPLSPAPRAGKRIFLSQGQFTANQGTGVANTLCAGEGSTLSANFVAMLSTLQRAGGSVLRPELEYVTVSGQLLGTGQEVASGAVTTGLWQYANGSFAPATTRVFTGSGLPREPGTATSTCSSWTSSDPSLTFRPSVGLSSETEMARWWFVSSVSGCMTSARLYCVEQ